MTDKTLIFTDGSSRGNPGPGGFGAIIVEGNNIIEIGDSETKTTNNRMEILAAIRAIQKTPVKGKIKIYTDSSYLINGITKWIHGWQKNNWKTQEKKEVMNKELWQELFEDSQKREVEWLKVKGHAGIPGNDRADEIATSFGMGEKINLFVGDRRSYEIPIKEPTTEQLSEGSERERKSSKAYSYLSLVDGELEKHSTWSECEKKVKGKRDVKFRKSISAEDELEILKSWGLRK